MSYTSGDSRDADALADFLRRSSASGDPPPTVPAAPAPRPSITHLQQRLEEVAGTLERITLAKHTPAQRQAIAQAQQSLRSVVAALPQCVGVPPAAEQPSADVLSHLFEITEGHDGHLVAVTRGIGPIMIAASDRRELARILPAAIARALRS